MMETNPFDPTPTGKRRSVFFTIGIATAFISYTAATSAYARSPTNDWMAIFLLALGTIALLFAVLVNKEDMPLIFE